MRNKVVLLRARDDESSEAQPIWWGTGDHACTPLVTRWQRRQTRVHVQFVPITPMHWNEGGEC